MHNFYLEEQNFIAEMKNNIVPELEKHAKHGSVYSNDGTQIAYLCYRNPNEKAAIVIVHGFCEFARKYDETAYYFYKAGYSVYLPELRGHGDSDRLLTDPEKVHVISYEDYVKDLNAFINAVVKTNDTTGKIYLFAHSMGGAVGALYMEEFPWDINKAVLSSPMLQMNYGKIPECAVKIIAVISKMMRWDERYAPGQHGFDGEPQFSTSSCLSKSRYDYIFGLRKEFLQYRTYGGTYKWSRAGMEADKKILKKENLNKIQIPVLLCQAGMDTMVKPGGQKRFATYVKRCTMVHFPDAKHEIFHSLQSTRIEYFETVLSFFDQV